MKDILNQINELELDYDEHQKKKKSGAIKPDLREIYMLV